MRELSHGLSHRAAYAARAPTPVTLGLPQGLAHGLPQGLAHGGSNGFGTWSWHMSLAHVFGTWCS